MSASVLKDPEQKFRLSGYINDKDLEGRGQLDNGKWIEWKAILYKVILHYQIKRKSLQPLFLNLAGLIYPFTAYGFTELPQQEDVLFKNATVWTSEKEGKLSEY